MSTMTTTSAVLSARSRTAMSRLRRDWKELQSEPIENIVAEPLETNIFEWHANLRPSSGPYYESGCIFHVILVFPDEYPSRPPQVRLCSTTLQHPNIFHYGHNGSVDGINYPYVCLDMIKESSVSGPYTGWSSAYSVSSLLMQLSAFLFDANVPQEYGGIRHNDVDHYQCLSAIHEARKFTCSGCGHTLGTPVPFLESNTEPNFDEAKFITEGERIKRLTAVRQQERQMSLARGKQIRLPLPNMTSRTEFPPLSFNLEETKEDDSKEEETKESETKDSAALLKELPDDVVNLVLDSLDNTDLQRIALLEDTRLKQVRDKYHRVAQAELRCYYHRTGLTISDFKDTTSDEKSDDLQVPDELLGVGLALEYHADGTIRNLSSPLDILSYRAFQEDGLRLSVWKETFTHFVPLAINTKHSLRALPLLEQILARLPGNKERMTSFDAPHTLNILCGLMNSMVVALMKTQPNTDRMQKEMEDAQPVLPDFKISMWQSEKAMLGYCAFHHLLLAMCARRPSLQVEAERRIRSFFTDARSRTKYHVPNLGELIVLTTIVESLTLDQLLPVLLPEMLARNVRWAFREKPLLECGDRVVPCRRLCTTFDASRTSLRLLMFQTHFVRSLHTTTDTGKLMNNTSRLQSYNQSYGRPRDGMALELQQACTRINQVNDWHTFFRTLGIPNKTPSDIHQMLIDAIYRSSKLRYHIPSRSTPNAATFSCICTYGLCAFNHRLTQPHVHVARPIVPLKKGSAASLTMALAAATPSNKPVKMSRRAAQRLKEADSA